MRLALGASPQTPSRRGCNALSRVYNISQMCPRNSLLSHFNISMCPFLAIALPVCSIETPAILMVDENPPLT